MTRRKTLTVQLMEAQATIEQLKAQLEAVGAQRDELELQLLNAEQYIARMEAPGAQRQVAKPQGAKLVREFRNADGVLMGKFKIGFNKYAYRPLGAQA